MAKKGFELRTLDYKASAHSSFPCHSQRVAKSCGPIGALGMLLSGNVSLLGLLAREPSPSLSRSMCSECGLQGCAGHAGARSEPSPPASAELYGGINKPFKKR